MDVKSSLKEMVGRIDDLRRNYRLLFLEACL